MKQLTIILGLLASILIVSGAPESRIVGGDDAVIDQVPYQAGLFIGGSPNCGAVILSEYYVLTGMQCVCSAGSDRPWPPQLFTVTVGSADLYQGKRIVVAEITVNPNYSSFETGIALLRLTEPLVFSASIQPIALARENPPVGSTVDISGWGRLKATDENMYRSLQINDATIIDEAECVLVLGRTDNQVLCVGHNRKNGICRGDFGGPAVYQDNLVGIAASVIEECGSYLPDIFSSMASNYDWIIAQIRN